MKILTGDNFKILESGTVISFKNESLLFELADLRITISFNDTDKKATEPHISYKTISAKELEIILANFTNPLGSGNTEPLKIGSLENKALYLNFRIFDLVGASGKTVHYTWYLREGAVNG